MKVSGWNLGRLDGTSQKVFRGGRGGFPARGFQERGEGQMQRQMQMQGWEVNDNVAVLKIEPRDAEIGRLFVKIEEGVRNIQE